jgi:hypothetical protein
MIATSVWIDSIFVVMMPAAGRAAFDRDQTSLTPDARFRNGIALTGCSTRTERSDRAVARLCFSKESPDFVHLRDAQMHKIRRPL